MTAYRILIVEDDADINLLLKTMLESSGYSVTSAFSGSEAKLVWHRSNSTSCCWI